MILITLLYIVKIVIVWLENLQRNKECACSQDWKRTYILRFLSFLFVWNIATGSILLHQLYQGKCASVPSLSNNLIYAVLRAAFGIGFVIYLVTAYIYARMLRDRDCKCAMNGAGYKWMRFLLFLYAIIMLSPFIIPLLIIFITLGIVLVRKLKK